MNNHRMTRTASRVARLFLLLLFLLPTALPFQAVSAQSEYPGYRDFSYPSGTGANNEPTGEKPESKLWWNGGFWYASLWSTAGNAYRIHRLDLGSQKWIDTGTALDNRRNTRADALWDGTKLYVVSHVFVKDAAAPAVEAERGRLYRYSYNPTNRSYTLDTGFPVTVTGGKSETLVIEKDDSGQLWVTYVESRKVMVNHSLNGDDRKWGTPYALPVGGAENVAADDISSIITFKNHTGIMWSNQASSPKVMYFAVHPNGGSDSAWTKARAYSASGDDHINLKTLQTDLDGNIYAAIKTSNNSKLIMLLACSNKINQCRTDADWAAHTVYDSAANDPTRPILVIDTSNRHFYVFTTNTDAAGNTGIYYKRASMDSPSFPTGIGTPFIRTSADTNISNATSTRQNVNSETGLVVMASATRTRYYLHNFMPLGGSPPPPPPPPPPAPSITGFTPASGPAGTTVTISGAGFSGATSVTFNNTPAASFTVDSNTAIRAVVPAGATSGPIAVSGPNGTGVSAASFTVDTAPNSYHLSWVVSGSGSVSLNPPGGNYAPGTVVMLTASPAAGWVFSGWSGDLSSTANPASLTMNANKAVTAAFTQQPSGGGVVAHEETVTGSAVSASAVTTAGSITGAGGSLYLAAVSSRASSTVSSVTGLGLTWTRVLRQCAGRNQTMLEVWMAMGPAPTSGQVTAQFPGALNSSVIAVSRYSGVNASAPVGAVLGGNTLGANGACAGGTDSGSYSFNLNTTASGAMVYGAAAIRNRTHSPGSGYTERTEAASGSSGEMASLAVMDKPAPAPAATALNGSFSSTVDWAVVGVEIRP